MDYIKITLKTNIKEDFVLDTISALLAEDGFESFDNEGGERHAYCPVDSYDKACIIGVLEEVPSAQPEKETCKDCKWEDSFGYGECNHCKRRFEDMWEEKR